MKNFLSICLFLVGAPVFAANVAPYPTPRCYYIISPLDLENVINFGDLQPDPASIEVSLSTPFSDQDPEYHRGTTVDTCDVKWNLDLERAFGRALAFGFSGFSYDPASNSITISADAPRGTLVKVRFISK